MSKRTPALPGVLVEAGLVSLILVTLGLVGPLVAAAADNPHELTTAERAELIALLERTQAETLALVEDVDGTRWHRQPAEGRWSIGEIVEHLILAEGAIRGRIDAMVKAGPTASSPSEATPSLEELVAVGSDRSRRFEAPEPIRPSGTVGRDEALRKLMSARSDSIRYVLETEQPLHSFSAMAPIGVELDGHGWLALLGAHNLRHNRQIVETLKQLDETSE